MPDNKKKRGAADRRRIAGGEAYEVAYAAKKSGKSPAQVRAAVKATPGGSRSKVMKKLAKKK